MDSLKFWDILDHHALNPAVPRLRPSVGFYPSEASIKVVDKDGNETVEGACIKSIFYKRKGFKPDTVIDADNFWKMELGNYTHEMIVESCKRAGIYIGDEVEFWDATHKISGRVDLIIRHPESKRIIGVEIKSIAGYASARNVLKSVYGEKLRPKKEHVLQAAIYLDWFSKNQNIHEWDLVYISREDGSHNQFCLTLSDTGEVLVDGEKTGILPEKIYERYKELEEAIRDNKMPDRDFELQYSHIKLLKMANDGDLTTKQSEDVKKGKLLIKGDAACGYCSFQQTCWDTKEKTDGEVPVLW